MQGSDLRENVKPTKGCSCFKAMPRPMLQVPPPYTYPWDPPSQYVGYPLSLAELSEGSQGTPGPPRKACQCQVPRTQPLHNPGLLDY